MLNIVSTKLKSDPSLLLVREKLTCRLVVSYHLQYLSYVSELEGTS
jgi:hypothetical protein